MENKNKELNNQILMDLLVKTSKLTQSIVNMLDINNSPDYGEVVYISSELFNKLQDDIIYSIKSINKIYIDELSKNKETSTEEKNKNGK